MEGNSSGIVNAASETGISEESERLKGELKRLKEHLISVEEEYTQEVLSCEKRETDLRQELESLQQTVAELREKLYEVSQTSKWQEKLNAAISERDQALDNVSKLDDKVHQLTASITNLQLVIEQMQKGNVIKLYNVKLRL